MKQNNGRPGTLIYFDDYFQITENMTKEEQADILRAFMVYARDGTVTEFPDRYLNQCYKQLCKASDMDLERYEKRVKQRSDAANKRWHGEQEEADQHQTGEKFKVRYDA